MQHGWIGGVERLVDRRDSSEDDARTGSQPSRRLTRSTERDRLSEEESRLGLHGHGHVALERGTLADDQRLPGPDEARAPFELELYAQSRGGAATRVVSDSC